MRAHRAPPRRVRKAARKDAVHHQRGWRARPAEGLEDARGMLSLEAPHRIKAVVHLVSPPLAITV